MVSLHVYSVLVVLFLTCGAIMATKENDQIIRENNCETKMGLPCVLEAFTCIFVAGSISSKCCGEVVVLGKVCHSALAATIIAKSIQTWNNCLALIDSPSPSA
ncbi:hypothetical protein ES332_D05G371600v1 [Gossypium tomentosum]|uniref:Prolamin-like domain-containing protein n=1 Tax=Gossypium tomentosum TaxID=34277 RepID=A0A5D2L4Q3_GOSTO|nr:hypothetical protein ES332_D05G371600v1 [Gossypium tomentosum]